MRRCAFCLFTFDEFFEGLVSFTVREGFSAVPAGAQANLSACAKSLTVAMARDFFLSEGNTIQYKLGYNTIQYGVRQQRAIPVTHAWRIYSFARVWGLTVSRVGTLTGDVLFYSILFYSILTPPTPVDADAVPRW